MEVREQDARMVEVVTELVRARHGELCRAVCIQMWGATGLLDVLDWNLAATDPPSSDVPVVAPAESCG